MAAELLYGRALASTVKDQIIVQTERLADVGVRPRLAVIIASDDPAVAAYAASKQRSATKLGIEMNVIDIDPSLGQAALNAQIEALSADPATHGILLELPLAKSLDSESAIDCIAPLKDVDGLTVTNLGRVAAGAEDLALVSATPRACVALAETAGSLSGAVVAVVGRGRTVGRPLAAMLTNRNATVTVCHSRTPDLAAALAPADMVFTATGSPGLINGDVLRQGQVVIDAGISVVDGGVVGDVDADSAAPLVRAMTPVPGGVGPLTSTLIFENVLRAMQLQGVVGEDLWAGQSAEADNA